MATVKFVEVPSKESDIKTSNFVKNGSASNKDKNPVEDRIVRKDSADFNKFGNEIQSNSEINALKRSKEMTITKKYDTKQTAEENSVDLELLSTKVVKQTSAIQMVNDLTHLLQTSEPNVFFRFGKAEVGLHSIILYSRSAWFRRSWRMANDQDHPLSNDYSFNYESSKKFDFDCEIKLNSKVPSLLNDRFDFDIILNNKQDERDFLKAFNQFKLFLYRGDCEINSSNSKNLVILGDIFKVDVFKEYLSSYYQKNIKPTNVDELIKTIELAHVYQIDDLKKLCIELINTNSHVVVNSACWRTFSLEYPELVLEIFRKKLTINQLK